MTKTDLPATMRAVRLHEFGPPDVLKLTEVPVPEPGPGEVLMKVNVIAVNNWDVRLRGKGPPQVPGRPPTELPFQPGREAAGEVVAVGDGVTKHSVGDRVVLMPCPYCGKCLYCLKRATNLCFNEMPGHTKFGAYAEYIVASEDGVLASPANRTDKELAPILWAFGAAFHGINLANISPGEVVLVTGAAGSVGIATIQLARLSGAETIIALSRSAERGKKLLKLGADVVLDHQDEASIQKIRQLSNGLGVDAVFDNYGSEETIDFSINASDLGGRIVLVAGAQDHMNDKIGVRTMAVFPKNLAILGTRGSTGWEQETLIRIVGQGKISMPIAHELPFEEIAKAHELQERGDFVGKIVLTM